MLVLSRKKNESIVINNDITVTVVEIRGDKVRLGIVAPKEVPVHRQEVYEAIHGKPADTDLLPTTRWPNPTDSWRMTSLTLPRALHCLGEEFFSSTKSFPFQHNSIAF